MELFKHVFVHGQPIVHTILSLQKVKISIWNICYVKVEFLDSSNYKKELDNREREQALTEALDAWKRISSDQFKERVIAERVR